MDFPMLLRFTSVKALAEASAIDFRGVPIGSILEDFDAADFAICTWSG